MMVRDGASNGHVLRLQVPPQARYARVVREKVARFAAERALDDYDTEDFVTALSEAFANAVQYCGSADPIEVEVRLHDDDMLVATVADHGPGFPAERLPGDLPSLGAVHGRGIPIMRRYSDLFSVQSDPKSGTRVMLARYLKRRPPPTAA
ncbi:MAG: anti-sigma regulatory factor [Candidatus Eremiobacteraeota bacterium]|nr:anti-sigma regulatory factor [Candidatus Eremiobacteraeota bacterium]MBV8353986.1 anti-sigma regulatory factor [Candidatus Eremiobacteraeota bacterium]